MTVLIIESVRWTPHLETGMELALKLRAQGQTVHYLCVRGVGGYYEDRPFRKSGRLKPRNTILSKNWRAQQILRQHGVVVHAPKFTTNSEPVPEFSDQDALKQYCENGWDIGMGAASSLISWSKRAAAQPADYRDTVIRMIRAGRLIYKNVVALCTQIKPTQVILFNGRFASTRPSLRAVQKLAIPVLLHERGCDPDHYYLQNFVPHEMGIWSDVINADSQKQSPEILAAGAHSFYARRRAGGAKDWHSFCNWQSGDIGKYEYLRELKPVVYFSSSDDEFIAIGEILKTALFDTQIATVKFLAQQCQILGLPLVVRLHPHLMQKAPEDLQFWHDQLNGIATVIDAYEKVDSYALMDLSSVCVSYGSTTGIEAVYWGRQHLLLGRAMYETLPGVCCVRQPEQLADLLLNPPPVNKTGAIAYGWYLENFGETFDYFKADGLHGGSFLGDFLDDPIGSGSWFKKLLKK